MVVIQLEATMNMMQVKYVPISGVVSVTGNMSPTMEEKMVMANIMVTPNESFSPESGGRVKPRTAMLEMSRQGMIRLEK